jgi:hypothetical protein
MMNNSVSIVYSSASLRLLVPLAPLARNALEEHSSPSAEPSSSPAPQTAEHTSQLKALAGHILCRSTPPSLVSSIKRHTAAGADTAASATSKQPASGIDDAIILELLRRTNLVSVDSAEAAASHTDSRDSSLCTSPLRGYQWAGVSWITQLRRCGLGGILAG